MTVYKLAKSLFGNRTENSIYTHGRHLVSVFGEIITIRLDEFAKYSLTFNYVAGFTE